MDREPCAGLFVPACVTGVEGGHGRVYGVEGETCNGSARGANTSLSLPHCCLVVPHAQGGDGFDEAVRMAVQVTDTLSRMFAYSVGLTIPMLDFLMGRERRVRRVGG